MASWDLNTIISAGICAAYVIAGAYLMDLLGITHLLRHPDTPLYRIFSLVVAGVILAMALGMTLAMGYDRGLEVLSTPPAAPGPEGASLADLLDASATAATSTSPGHPAGIALGIFMGHAGLMMLCTLVSFSGLVQIPILLWLLVLGLPLIALSLLQLPLMLLHGLGQWVAGIAVVTIHFFLNLARLVARPFGEWLGPAWAETHRPVGAVSQGAVATDKSDTEQPPPPPDPVATTEVVQDEPIATPTPAADATRPSRNWDPYGAAANPSRPTP